MKIEPINPLKQAAPIAGTRPGAAKDTPSFAAVLAERLTPAANAPVDIRPVAPTNLTLPLAPTTENDLLSGTTSLLEELETYQKLLLDPAVTLREIAPGLSKIQQLADKLASRLGDMPQNHPARRVAEQTLSTACLEIERFNSGIYNAS